jgi:hypothetical protein
VAIQASNIADLVTTTLSELGRLKFTDIMSDYQQTVALKRLLKKNKMTFDSGKTVSFNVITDHSNSARFVGLGAQDVVNITNQMTTGDVPWRHATWNWAHDFREPLMNSGASKIVDLIKTRRIAAFGSAIILFERALWRVPATTDDTTMYGIPYYVVKSNTAATFANNDGFNGTVPSGYTTVAGLSPTTYPRWRNYATQYTAVTKDDFVRKVRRMLTKINFTNLVDETPDYNSGNDMGLYTNYAVVGTLEEILESQNENLGSDVASMDGKALFRRSPVEYIPELENDTTNPFYAINWGEMGFMGLKGAWMKESMVNQVPGQHTMSATHTDCTGNLITRNRRRHGVVATDTGLPA